MCLCNTTSSLEDEHGYALKSPEKLQQENQSVYINNKKMIVKKKALKDLIPICIKTKGFACK